MIDAFLSYLESELCYSAHTVRAYASDLALLADFVTGGKPDEFRPQDITLSDLRAWIAWQGEHRLSSRTQRRRILSVRALFRFLRKTGRIDSNPAADLALPRLPRSLPAFVREQEMEQILSPEAWRQATGHREFRDLLVVELLYSTGMRRAELISLRDSDVDTRKGEVKITGKRNKQRLVPLLPGLCEHIDTYRRLRLDEFPGADPEAFILGDRGMPLNNSALSSIVKIQLAHTTTTRRTPHVLRHSFATAMLRHDARLDSVKELLGHSSLSTTQVYTHLSFSELKHNYQQAHPRAKDKHSPWK